MNINEIIREIEGTSIGERTYVHNDMTITMLEPLDYLNDGRLVMDIVEKHKIHSYFSIANESWAASDGYNTASSYGRTAKEAILKCYARMHGYDVG